MTGRKYKAATAYPRPDGSPERTAEQQTAIGIRRGAVLSFVADQFRDPGLASIGGTGLWSAESIQRARLIMLGKVALIHDGQALFDHWELIEPELAIPWSLHVWHIDEQAWTNRLSPMGRQLHTTDTGSASGWEPVSQAGPPALTDVRPLDVLHACNLIGGSHPWDDHPPSTVRSGG